MWLDAVLSPDAVHRHMRDIAQFRSQLTRGPVRRSVRRFVFGGARQHPCLDPISHFVTLASGVACKQPRQPFSREALAPTTDVAIAAVELGANLGPSQPLGQHEAQTPGG